VTFRRDDQNAEKPTFYDRIQLIQSHLYATTGFTIALAVQLNKFNINVNTLRPGTTDTRVHLSKPPEVRAKMRRPDDIKKVAVFLASQGPMDLTGESIDAPTWGNIYLNRGT